MIALITGASSGIGEATARRLAREPGTRLVLVARREERLQALAREIGGDPLVVAVDLTDDDAPTRILAALTERHDRLDLLVNNAGAGWRGTFGDVGADNLRRHVDLNLHAPARLTEALLPLLRASAPSSIVNVASTAGRISRAGSGAYSASKFALIGWTDALHMEERPNGVHVGLVNPGFVPTEGFPQQELIAKAATRWMVSTPEKVAEAILDAGPGGAAERYAPRPYRLAGIARLLLPGLTRKVLGGGGAKTFATSTGADAADRRPEG